MVEVAGIGPDPGDLAVLDLASQQGRVLVTIDTDFGRLVQGGAEHAGLLRLPDVPTVSRIELLADVLRRYLPELESGAVVTVKGGRIRTSRTPRW